MFIFSHDDSYINSVIMQYNQASFHQDLAKDHSMPTAMPTQTARQKSSTIRIIKVAVPCPLYRSFDYLLKPDIYECEIKPGMRVRVPFGRQNLIGIIIEQITSSEIANNKLKAISKVLDDNNLLSEDVLKLLLWSARYYVHPLGDALQTAMPVFLRSHDDATPQLTTCWSIDKTAGTADEMLQRLKRAPKQYQVLQLFLDQTIPSDSGPTAELDADALNELTDNWRPAVKALLGKGLLQQREKPVVRTAIDTDTQ